MLVAADIGNTNIVLAIFDGDQFVQSFRVYTDARKTSDEYFVVFNALFRESGIKSSDVDRAIISSVVPNLTRSVEKNLQRMMDTFIATPPTETIIDQWQSQIFARLLMRATVVFVSDAPDDMVADLHMVPAHSMDEALAKADEILAAKGITDGSILSIPDGVSVMVV